MSIATFRHLMCDEPECHADGPVAESAEGAKRRAERDGWDVGPRKIRNGIWEHTDYCPDHKRAGSTVTVKER